jgi:hypothetical protein
MIKRYSIVSAFFMAALFAAFAFGASTAAAKEILRDQFDGLEPKEIEANSPEQAGGLYGWQIDAKPNTVGSTSVTQDPANPNNLVLKHSYTSGGTPFRAIRSFEPITAGVATIEFKIRRATNPAFLFAVYDSAGNSATWINFQASGGNFGMISRYDDDASATNLYFPDGDAPRISTNTWFTIKFVMDVTNSTTEIYVDGQRMVGTGPFENGVFPLRPGTNIAQVAIAQTVTNAGTVYLDDLIVTSEGEPAPSSVEISGPGNIQVPEAGQPPATAQYTGTVKDQFGQAMSGQTVRWALKQETAGVTVDGTSGIVSVSSSATAEQFTLRAYVEGTPSIAAEKNVTLLYSGAPQWPADSQLTAVPDFEQATLSWNGIPSNQHNPAVGYAVYVLDGLNKTVVSNVYTVTGNVYTSVVGGLTPATTYTFKVEAVSRDGKWSTNGPSLTLTTLRDTAPPQWTDGKFLTVSDITYDRVRLAWSADATDNRGVVRYQISANEQVIATIENVSPLEYEVTGLMPGYAYTFGVQAMDEAGNVSTDGPAVDVKMPTFFAADVRIQVGSSDTSALKPGQMLDAVATVTNYRQVTQQLLLVVVLFAPDGTMVDIAQSSKMIAPSTVDTLHAGLRLPSDVTGYTAKAFVWEGADLHSTSMKPLSEAVVRSD